MKTFEELIELKQAGKLSWLEFVKKSEFSQEYEAYCKESNITENSITAFQFLTLKTNESQTQNT